MAQIIATEEELESLTPWEQLEGERDEDYAHFLRYLYAGPRRTYLKAYVAFMTLDGGQAPVGLRTAPGCWSALAARNMWRSRAASWDLYHLRVHGKEVAIRWVRIADLTARKVERALRTTPVRNIDELVALMNQLAVYMSPDVLKSCLEAPRRAQASGEGESLTLVG